MKKPVLMLVSCFYAFALSAQNSATPPPATPVNGGNNLREVVITDQKTEVSAFDVYVNLVNQKISDNDKLIALLKANITDNTAPATKESMRYAKTLESLEGINNELKTDLSNYLHYGKGDWNQFRKEFGEDLAFLDSKLNELNFVPQQNLIVQNTK